MEEVTKTIVDKLVRGMVNRNPDGARMQNMVGPNKFDTPVFDEYIKKLNGEGVTMVDSRKIARALIKYHKTQLPGIAAEQGLSFAPSAEKLADYAQIDPFKKKSNGNGNNNQLQKMKIYVEECIIDEDSRLATRFDWGRTSKEDWSRCNNALRKDMKQVKAHFCFNPEGKFWHIPNKHYMVKRAFEVFKDHDFDITELEPYTEAKPTMNHNKAEWFTWTKDEVGILLPYDAGLVEDIKTITGRRFSMEEKRWYIPITTAVEAADILDSYNLTDCAEALRNSPELDRWVEEEAQLKQISGALSLNAFDAKFATLEEQLDELIPEGLELMDFQKAAVAFIELTQGKALVADEMGCGKTIEAIARSLLHDGPTLIVCPASLKINWANELRKWAPERSVYVYFPTATQKFIRQMEQKEVGVITSKEDLPDPDFTDYIVVNYEAVQGKRFKGTDGFWKTELKPYSQKLYDYDFESIIFDEVHYLKDHKAQRSAGALMIAKKIGDIVAMSGTPILNKPVEFFTTLRLLKPTDFSDWQEYVTKYCGAYRDRFGWQIGGSSNPRELNFHLKSVMIRRKKDDVLLDLEPKIRQRLEVEMEKPAEYHRKVKAKLKELEDEDTQAKHLVIINYARQEAARQKVKAVAELAQSVVSAEDATVVFYHHHEIGDFLAEHFTKLNANFATIDGRTPMQGRQQLVDDFQNEKTDILLCSTSAAGQGLTMTRARTVIFAEREWVPALEHQAEDRLHRIGQKRVVQAVYVSCMDSIDEDFDEAIREKEQVLSEVLDGKEWTKAMMPVLMDSLKEKYE